MNTVVISVPCEVAPVWVRCGYGEQLSPMELAVLEVMAREQADAMSEERSGSAGIDELRELLGLGHRLMLNLVADLWRKGYVSLDIARGEVSVTPEVIRHYHTGTLDLLPSAEVAGTDKKIMIDKLSGHVLPLGGANRPAEAQLAVPVEGSDVSIDDATLPQLLDALGETLRREHEGQDGLGRQRKVLAAHVPPQELREDLGLRWVQVEVGVGLDPMTNRLRISVEDDSLPFRLREVAAARLTKLTSDYPDSRFAQALRGKADLGLESSLSLDAALDRFDSSIGKAASVRAGRRRDHHLELCDQARRLEDLLRGRVAAEALCSVAVGADAHAGLVTELIDAAKRQVVLVSPVIDYRRLHSLLGPLRSALDREVRVVFVWGRRHGDHLEEPVLNILRDLWDQAGDQVIFSKTPSRTNACMVIADDRAALVSGSPLLRRVRTAEAGRTPHPLPELGVRLSAPAPGPCTSVEDLLDWARKAIPDYLTGRKVLTRHGDFGSAEESAPPSQPTLPREPPDTDDGPMTVSEILAWCQAWEKHASSFRQRVSARTLPWIRVLRDDEHRDVFSDALSSARDRIIVSSRRVGPEMTGLRFEGALRKRLADGVRATVVFDEDRSGDSGDPGFLRDVRAEFPGRLLVRQQRTNARALVADDELVVGSFDFLSAGSDPPYRRPSEVGITITGGTIADSAADALGVAAEIRRHDGPTDMPTPDPVLGGIRSQDLLGDLRTVETGAEPDRAHVIQRHFSATPDPALWQFLEDLEAAHTTADILRVAAAHALRRGGDQASARRWWHWLVLERWHAGAFVEAWILRAMIDDPATRPRERVAAAAATRGYPEFGEAITEAVLAEDLAEAERVALAVMCAGEMLFAEESDHADAADEALDVLADSLAEPWGEAAAIVRRYWTTAPAPTLAADPGRRGRRAAARRRPRRMGPARPAAAPSRDHELPLRIEPQSPCAAVPSGGNVREPADDRRRAGRRRAQPLASGPTGRRHRRPGPPDRRRGPAR